MYCSKCGKEIDNAAVFCSHCGQPVEVNQNSAPPAAPLPYGPAPVQPVMPAYQPPMNPQAANVNKTGKLLLWIGIGITLFGVLAFLVVAFVGLIVFGKAYFYNGYDYTKVICTIDICLMLGGSGMIVAGFVIDRIKNKSQKITAGLIVGIISIVLAICFSVILIVNAITSAEKDRAWKTSMSKSYYSFNMINHNDPTDLL